MIDELSLEDNRFGNFVDALSCIPDNRDNRGKKKIFFRQL
jgi:hypothetical protein